MNNKWFPQKRYHTNKFLQFPSFPSRLDTMRMVRQQFSFQHSMACNSTLLPHLALQLCPCLPVLLQSLRKVENLIEFLRHSCSKVLKLAMYLHHSMISSTLCTNSRQTKHQLSEEQSYWTVRRSCNATNVSASTLGKQRCKI